MMKQQDIILKSIDHQLEIFTEQYLMAREHNDSIPLIEIDLMKHSIRTLYQQLQYLQQIVQVPAQAPSLDPNPTTPIFQFKKENIVEPSNTNSTSIEFSEKIETNQPIVSEKQVEIENINFTNVVEENKTTEILEEVKFVLEEEPEIEQKLEEPKLETISEQPYVKVTIEQPQFVPVVEEQVIEEINEEPVLEKEIAFEVNEPSVQKSTPVSTQAAETKKKAPAMMASLFDEAPITVASKFKEQESVSDKIAKQYVSPTIAERMSVKPVVDLKKSIGINERFSFINELFSGDQQLFMESIDKINSQNAYEEARRILYEDLAGRMNWNISAKPFSDLDDLVKRRFNA